MGGGYSVSGIFAHYFWPLRRDFVVFSLGFLLPLSHLV